MEQRFGLAYRFEVSLAAEQATEHMIIPTALQGLIENAVKHNEGSARLPLPIRIAMDGDYLTVSNQLRPSPIIFTTAYDNFLLPAFDRNGIGIARRAMIRHRERDRSQL